MSEVLVRYSYTAEQDDELSFKVGDVIKNVVTMDGGWWEGELNGKKGMFPDNFVEITKGNDKDDADGTKINHKGSTKSHVAQLANKLKEGVHIGSSGAPKKRESLHVHMKKKKQKAKVKHQYTAEHEDELSLEADDVIDVIRQIEDGWMEGTLDGKQGLFPSNFVELFEEDEETEKTDEPKKETEDDFREIKGKKVQGVGLGNIFGSGPIKLKSTAAAGKRGSPHIDSESKDEKTAVNTEVARREKGQTASEIDPLSVDVCPSSTIHSECTTPLHTDHSANLSAQASNACSDLSCTSTPNEHSVSGTNSCCYFADGGLTNKLSDDTCTLDNDIWPIPAPRIVHLRNSVEGGDSLGNSIIPCTKPGKHTRCRINFASGNYSMALSDVKSSSTPEIKSVGLEGKNIKSFLYGSPFFEGNTTDSQESIPGDVELNGHPITDSMILNKRRLSLPRSTPKRLKFSFSPYRKSDSTKAKQRKYEKSGTPTSASSEHVKFSPDTVFSQSMEEATPKRLITNSLTTCSPAGDLTLTETQEKDVDNTLIEQGDAAINEETKLLLPQETSKDAVDVSAYSDELSVFSRLLSRISPDKFVRPLSDSNLRKNKEVNKKNRWSLPNLRLRRRKSKEEKENSCHFDSISESSSSPEKDRYNKFPYTDTAILEPPDQISSDEPKTCNILSAKGAYLNTLNEDGKLSPYMSVIAKRYRLFDPDQRLKRSDFRFSAIDSSRLHPGYEVPYMPCTRSDTVLGSSLGHIPSVRLTPAVGGILANRKGSLSHDAHLDKLVLSVDEDGLVNDLEINCFVDCIISTAIQEIVNEVSELDTDLQSKLETSCTTRAAPVTDSMLQKGSELDIFLTRYIESIIDTAVYICVMEKKKYQTYHPSKVSYSKGGRKRASPKIPQIIIHPPSDDEDQDQDNAEDIVAIDKYEIGLDNFVNILVGGTLHKIESEEMKRAFRMNKLADVAEEIEDETYMYSENGRDNREGLCGSIDAAADDVVDLLLRRVSNANLSISEDEYDDIASDRLEKQDSNLDAHSLDRFISPEKVIVDTINQEIITDELAVESTKEPDFFSNMPSYSIGLLSSFEDLFDAKLKDYKTYETFDVSTSEIMPVTPVSAPVTHLSMPVDKSTTAECLSPDSDIVVSFSSSTDDELMEKNLQTISPDLCACLEQAGSQDRAPSSEVFDADRSAVTVVDVDESCNPLQGSFRHFVSPTPPEKSSLKTRQQNVLKKLSAFRNREISGPNLVPLRRLAAIRHRSTIPKYRHSIHVNLPVVQNEYESALFASSDTSQLNNNQNKFSSPRTRPMSCILDGDLSHISDVSDRFLVLDRSTSVCSLSKTLSPSPAPRTLNMQDEFVSSSISKRGRLPIWRKKHLPKESSEAVELIGYRKRYEVGTPMYDIIPQLNRQLRGEDVVCDDFNNSNISSYSPSLSKGMSPALMTPLQDTLYPHEHGGYNVFQPKNNSENFTDEECVVPEDENLIDRSSHASDSCHTSVSIDSSIIDQNIVCSSTDKEGSFNSRRPAYDEVDVACHLLSEALRGHGVDDDLSITSLLSDDVNDVPTLGMFLDSSPDNAEKAIVRYSYTAVHEDELSLSVGEVINIVDREIEDSGWWKGEVNGKAGVFPDNFVELLPEPKSKRPSPPLPVVANSKPHNDDTKAEKTLSPTEPEKSFSKKKDSPGMPEPFLNDRVPPAVPAKKPILPPPPVGKKPMHQRSTEMLASKGKVSPEPKRLDEAEIRVTRTSKGHTDKEKTESSEMNFDSIETHPDKLSHLTANRARLPSKRRPPSTVGLFVGNGEENGLDVDVKKETSPPIEEEPQEKPVIKETGVGKRAVNLRPAPHPITPHTTAPSSYSSSNSVSSIASKRASFMSSSSTPTATAVVTTISSLTKTSSVLSKTSGASPSITSDSKVGSHVVLKSETVQLPPGAAAVHTGKTQVDQSALENLKKELHELRSNSVSKATYNELKSEVEKLRKDLEFIKTSYSRKFMDLTHEIDEEKKIRLNTQVELDRLKKMVNESSI